ncbi:MAG: hypothetical protein LIV24_09520 [Eubacterium sp.]|nr:hypothetical protein [Eubacterium sp.]
MSQKKVDLYKEEKRNRKKIMKREKIRSVLTIVAVVAVFGALIGWFSWAVYNNVKDNQDKTATATTTELDLSDIEAYNSSLSEYVANQEAGTDSSSSSSSASGDNAVTGTSAGTSAVSTSSAG